MFKIIKPCLMIDRIDGLNLNQLVSMGIKGMVIDIDNTITRHNQLFCEPWATEFIFKAKQMGIKICLVSNNNQKRVKPIADQLGVEVLANAGKPFKYAYDNAFRILNLNANQVAAIGDQLFTDIIGGNKVGSYTVLVRPICKNEALRIRIIRPFESLVKRVFGGEF